MIDVVKGYQESEKLVMLKISDDISSAQQVSEVHQQSNMVLATANGMAQRYPELKASEKIKQLTDSIEKNNEQKIFWH